MSDSLEEIAVAPCPMCGGEHRYAFEVRRSFVMGLIVPGTIEPVQREFRRYVTCPKKDGTFRVTVTLWESSSDRIEAVSEGQLTGGGDNE